MTTAPDHYMVCTVGLGVFFARLGIQPAICFGDA